LTLIDAIINVANVIAWVGGKSEELSKS